MQHNNIALKIRNNLINQKKRLEEYLAILEKEEEDIIKQDADKLIEHIQLENNIVEEIVSFRKILEPLEIIYFNSPYKKDNEILIMKSNIDNMLKRINEKQKVNKEKLSQVMENIEGRIKEIKKRIFTRPIYYTGDSRILDLNG